MFLWHSELKPKKKNVTLDGHPAQQIGAGWHVHASLLNPLAVQQEENEAGEPEVVVMFHRHTSLSPENLPSGSSW